MKGCPLTFFSIVFSHKTVLNSKPFARFLPSPDSTTTIFVPLIHDEYRVPGIVFDRLDGDRLCRESVADQYRA